MKSEKQQNEMVRAEEIEFGYQADALLRRAAGAGTFSYRATPGCLSADMPRGTEGDGQVGGAAAHSEDVMRSMAFQLKAIQSAFPIINS